MERIVNGHYADPESTRDIIGITPKEFEILINILREKFICIEKMFELEPEQLEDLLIRSSNHLNVDPAEALDQIPDIKNQLEEQYSVILDYLNAINQPYPGAQY